MSYASLLSGRRRLALAVMLGIAWGQAALAADVWVIDDFEQGAWEGTTQSTEHVKQGRHAARWSDLKSNTTLRVHTPRIPKDWTRYDRLTFWLHSAKANGQRLTIVCNSENKDAKGWDYYVHHLTVDWQGWRLISLKRDRELRGARKPRGWDQIDWFGLHSAGWNHKPLPDTVLHIDDVKLVRDPVEIAIKDRTATRTTDDGHRVTYTIEVANRASGAREFALSLEPTPSKTNSTPIYKPVELSGSVGPIPSGASATVAVELLASAEVLKHHEPLTYDRHTFRVAPGMPEVPAPHVTLEAIVPLPKREHPLLFADAETFARAKDRAAKCTWAKKQVDRVVGKARGILKNELVVPDEPGQWSHHYVCKECGAGLRYDNAEGLHRCKRCKKTYTGWPYDQVVLTRIHGGNWRAIRELGLAYALTGDEAFAQRARRNLLAYAEKYADYPLHNVRGKVSRSAGRVFAQTLDEAVSIIGAAWGYDLIYNSPCLRPEDKHRIETRFLREAVKTIRRHDAGISNWQSWHNAGMAAVGFCIEDAEIAAHAINGKSGLRFQYDHSVLPDGFWFEGATSYHYYALMAIRWASEAAHHAGIDVYSNDAHKSLYLAPIEYVFPNLCFPAVNDSNVFSIKGRHYLYELAYARWGDPQFLHVAKFGKRGSLEALLWGKEALPSPPELRLESKDFQGLGAAVLRQGAGKDQTYLHLDYGPHGGGHGHPDKLAIILFALGKHLAPDPSRLAYAAPLHRSWYKQTFSHNTVCVDRRSQRPAEGKLTLFGSKPGLAVARATCDTAYPGVKMTRTLAVTDGYVVDVFDLRSQDAHTYDWLYHNFGTLEPGMQTAPRDEPLGDDHGYQHMKDITQAETAETWHADFKQEGANVRLTMLGEPGTQVYFGMGVSENPPRPCPMLVVRRRGKRATFVSVIEPYRQEPAVTGLHVVPGNKGERGACVQLELLRGRDRSVVRLDVGATQ